MPQDVKHRWNTPYLQLHTASYKTIIDAYIVVFNALSPDSQFLQNKKYE